MAMAHGNRAIVEELGAVLGLATGTIVARG